MNNLNIKDSIKHSEISIKTALDSHTFNHNHRILQNQIYIMEKLLEMDKKLDVLESYI